MNITRDNYESFFLDYLEGNLEESKIDQFLDFLEQNPDLKEELHLFENIHLPEEPVIFKGKKKLYKPADIMNDAFELKAVAYMEGDLKDNERQTFKASLKGNPHLQKEVALFEKTRLIADTSIEFPQKDKLYRKPVIVAWINWMGKAAAILILLWGVHSLFQTGEEIKVSAPSTDLASIKVSPETIDQKKTSVTPEKIDQNKESIAKVIKPVVKSRHRVDNVQQRQTIIESATEPHKRIAEKEISPIMARLESEPVEMALAVPQPNHTQKIKYPHNVITVDEYLAYRAKKVSNDGILSANRLLRFGLNVASELSGEHLGYSVKNGKVASVGFESKLMAFSIPLEKK